MGGLGKTTAPLVIKIPVSTLSKYTQSIFDWTSLNNFIISSLAAASLSWLPYEVYDDGKRIPTIIFKGKPSAFNFFVIFVMFGFSASFSALFSHNRPKVARVFRSCSVISLLSAAAVLLLAAFSSSGLIPSLLQ